MTTGSITSMGVGSSMDLQGMLDAQREADEAVLDLKKQEIEEQQAVQAELDFINAQVFSMKTNALNLSLASNYIYREVSTSSPEVATATAADGTATGSHRVETTRLASGSSYMSQGVSSPQDPVTQDDPENGQGSDTFSYCVGDGGEVCTIPVAPGTSMEELAEAINSDPDNPGVTASVIDTGVGDTPYKLVLEADETGEDSRISITDPLDGFSLEEKNGQGYTVEGDEAITLDPPLTVNEAQGNNTIVFEETDRDGRATSLTATIPDGVYDTPEDLALAVEEALEAESGASGNEADYQVDIDPVSGMMSIQESGTLEEVALKWEDPSTTASEILGFSGTATITPAASSLNAEVIVEGVHYQRQENKQLDGIIEGVTLNLYSTGVTTIDVAADTSTVEQEILAMIETYNALIAEIDANDDYDETTDTWGSLSRSSSAKSLQRDLQACLSTTIDTGTGITSLYDLGMEINRDGTITIDEDILHRQLEENFEDVQTLFLGTEEVEGLAFILNDELGSYAMSSGYIAGEINAIDEKIARMEADYERQMALLDKKYDTMAREYAELDTYLAEIEATQSYIYEMTEATKSGD